MHGHAGCVPGACEVLSPGAMLLACPSGGLPVEGSSAGSLVAALWAVPVFRRLLRGACSSGALAADAAPGRPGKIRRIRSYCKHRAEPEGHSHLPSQCKALAYNAMTGQCLSYTTSVIN